MSNFQNTFIFKFKTAQNSKNLDLMVIQVLNSKHSFLIFTINILDRYSKSKLLRFLNYIKSSSFSRICASQTVIYSY